MDWDLFFSTCFGINFFVFTVFLAFELYVVICIRFKLDKAAGITLLSYTFCFMVRMFVWANKMIFKVGDFELYFDLMVLICSLLTWMALYYFVFEMQAVKIKLECQTIPEYQAAYNRFNKTRISVALALLIIQIAFLAF